MDFSYPAHVEQLRAELRSWLTANLTDETVRAGGHRDMDDATFATRRRWDATVADAGWGAMSWPREYGGRGASVLEQLVHAEEITRARTPLPLNVIGINNIGPAIMQYGTEAQKRELLPRMVRADDNYAHAWRLQSQRVHEPALRRLPRDGRQRHGQELMGALLNKLSRFKAAFLVALFLVTGAPLYKQPVQTGSVVTLAFTNGSGAPDPLRALAEGGVGSVAIGFLHAYVNPDHELRARDELSRHLPGVEISISSEVSPEMREYERISTTCANAYVQPLMSTHLARLEAELHRIGITCPLFLMLSGGGITTLETARRFPVRLVESGPAGGAIGAPKPPEGGAAED